MFAMASSEASNAEKETKPYPLDKLASSRAIYDHKQTVFGPPHLGAYLGRTDQTAKPAERIV